MKIPSNRQRSILTGGEYFTHTVRYFKGEHLDPTESSGAENFHYERHYTAEVLRSIGFLVSLTVYPKETIHQLTLPRWYDKRAGNKPMYSWWQRLFVRRNNNPGKMISKF